jgi:hypothetical protein
MIIWGNGSDGGGRYNPAANNWIPISNIAAPANRFLHAAVWSGTEMVIFGGGPAGGTDGTSYLSDTWTYTPGNTMFLYQKP